MFRKNTASQFIHFQGVDATTGGIKSGVTWTARRCIDGTFAAAGGTVTEDGTTGWYKFAMSQADTNGNNIGFNFTGTGAVPQTVNIITDGSPPDVNLKNAAGTAVTLDSNNVLNVSTKYVGGTSQTAGDICARLPAALGANGNMKADVRDYNGTAGTFASGRPEVNTTHAAGTAWGSGAITAASIAASALNGKGDWNIGKTGYALSAAGVQAIWDALTSALTTVGSIGKLLVDNINATISSRLATSGYTAPLDAAGTRSAVGLASANLDTQLSGINSKTTNLPASPAATGDAMTLTAGERNSTADAILTRSMTEAYPAVAGTLTPAKAMYSIHQHLMEKSISGTTLTVKKRDQSTTAKTATLDSSTAPTAITEAS